MYRDQLELEVRHVKMDQLKQWLENRERGLPAHGDLIHIVYSAGKPEGPPFITLPAETRNQKSVFGLHRRVRIAYRAF